MAYTHIAHDCHIGSETIFGNAATLAGHVDVEDYANVGAFSGVHQFCRVGKHAFIGGYSVVTKDALPFRENRRQPRADLRHQHHRPEPPRLLAGHDRQAAPRATACCCTRTPAAPSRRSSATPRSRLPRSPTGGLHPLVEAGRRAATPEPAAGRGRRRLRPYEPATRAASDRTAAAAAS